jgi:aspartyl-tRNA(Asn)/glutamyl-tRNA(Gln) amidotransferase subunit A
MSPPPLNVLELANSVQIHRRTAREVVDEALARAEQHQDKWRAFITLTPDLARKQAEQVDRRIGAGEKLALAGVPFGVKDLIDVAGIPTTGGSKAFADRVPEENAAVVQRLIDQGAVVLGKLNLHECAFGFTGENPHYGDCRNPWNPQRIVGGSSSGSAVAVALGICPFTLGSDTGGSIRLPASLCGLVGLKPTYGRVARSGGIPLSWSMDHVGPITRTAAEATAVLTVMAAHDPAGLGSSHRPVDDYRADLPKPIQGLRIGVPQNWFFESLEPDVAHGVEAAIQQLMKLGGRRVDVTLPYMEEAVGAHRAIIFSEAAEYYRPFLADRADQFDDAIRPLLMAGLFLPTSDYLHAQRVRHVIRAAWNKVFENIDCLVTPTSPVTATRFGQESAELPRGAKPLVRAFLDMTLPFNMSGHPAVTVPCGFCRERLPIGMQLVGRPFAEATLLRIAHQYQQATSWHEQALPA